MEIWPIFRLSENVAKTTQVDVVNPAESIAPIFRSIRQPQNPQSVIFGVVNFCPFLAIFAFLVHLKSVRNRLSMVDYLYS